MNDHYGATVLFFVVFILYTWGLVSFLARHRRRREHAAWVRHWNTTPRDGRDLQGRELPDFDALFASITARIDEEGTA